MSALVFNTEAEIDAALVFIDDAATTYWTGEGFIVDEKGLVSRNAMTGRDQPKKARVTTWDVKKERHTDGKWWIWGFDGKPYKDGIMVMLDENFSFTLEVPTADWYPPDEE